MTAERSSLPTILRQYVTATISTLPVTLPVAVSNAPLALVQRHVLIESSYSCRRSPSIVLAHAKFSDVVSSPHRSSLPAIRCEDAAVLKSTFPAPILRLPSETHDQGRRHRSEQSGQPRVVACSPSSSHAKHSARGPAVCLLATQCLAHAPTWPS